MPSNVSVSVIQEKKEIFSQSLSPLLFQFLYTNSVWFYFYLWLLSAQHFLLDCTIAELRRQKKATWRSFSLQLSAFIEEKSEKRKEGKVRGKGFLWNCSRNGVRGFWPSTAYEKEPFLNNDPPANVLLTNLFAISHSFKSLPEQCVLISSYLQAFLI